MLQLKIPENEFYDESSEEFIIVKETTLQLEHSLISLAKWESKWQIPFLVEDNKTNEQMIDYIRCMTINQNVDPNVYKSFSRNTIHKVNEYIANPMTATWFSDEKGPINREIVTAEIIYYWMIVNNIPFECQKWHLNRLLTLIRVCSVKNAPKKKMSKREIINRNRELNQRRRSQINSKG